MCVLCVHSITTYIHIWGQVCGCGVVWSGVLSPLSISSTNCPLPLHPPSPPSNALTASHSISLQPCGDVLWSVQQLPHAAAQQEGRRRRRRRRKDCKQLSRYKEEALHASTACESTCSLHMRTYVCTHKHCA